MIEMILDFFQRLSLPGKVVVAIPLVFILMLIIVALYIILRFSVYIFTHIFQIGKFSYLPRHPNYAALLSIFKKNGEFETEFVDGCRKPDGTFHPLTLLGPWGDGNPYIGVVDADLYREILLDQKRFPKMPNTYRWFSNLVGSGLVAQLGPFHKEQRKRITPLFHFKILKQIAPSMIDITEILVNSLIENKEFQYAKSLFSLHTIRVIINLAFGGDFDADWMAKAWYKVTRLFSDWTIGWIFLGHVWNHVPLPAASGFLEARDEVRNKIREVVINRRNHYQEHGEPPESERSDLLYYLLMAKDSEGNPVEIDEEHIINEAVTFLFAGHDTSSCTLAWVYYYMTQRRDIYERVKEEVDEVIGDRKMVAEDIPKLKLIKNVIKETLRLRSAIPMVDRIAAEDCVLDGKFIPKGTYLGLLISCIGKDPRYWDDPDVFNPDRFNVRDEKRHDFANLPFGAGERNCIGSKFADQEMVIAIAMIAQKLDVEYDDTQKIVPTYEGVVEPSNLYLRFKPRTDK